MTWGGLAGMHLPRGAAPATDAERTEFVPAKGLIGGHANRAGTAYRWGRISAGIVLALGIAAAGAGCVAAPVVRSSSAVVPSFAPIPGERAPLPLEDRPSPAVVCADVDLPVRVVARDAAMGLRVVVLEVTNCTDASVLVQGYPALALRDEDQQMIVVAATHGTTGGVPDPGPVPVELVPGASAEANLSWRNTVTEGTAHTADRLLVAPIPDGPDPNEGGARLQVLDENIDVGTTATIDVTAWQPAS